MIVTKHTKPNNQKCTHENVFLTLKEKFQTLSVECFQKNFFYEHSAVNFLQVFPETISTRIQGFRMPLIQLLNNFLADNKS